MDLIQYDMRCYFNMRSKADISQLHYCMEPKSGETCKKRITSEVLVSSPGNPSSQSWRRKGRLRCEGFAEKEGYKPGMKE